ncbi:glycoside hydrolase [Corynespora cassiicola Philippines]|uniref:alpha-L-fucosidase n=1 Tax=Corynespora cassiicola Philippines TaxID=1448308 RepID=A0A2T2NKD4_CORCC|nr:glycoside hydrolase [Corynespora cassiicola Philippines]
MPQNNFQPISGQAQSIPIDLNAIFDNRAFGIEPNETNFDGSGDAYPAQFIPPSNFTYTGLNYHFASYNPSGKDNAIAAGQTIAVPRGRYLSVHMLAASEAGMAQGTINATYGDDSTGSSAVLVPAWWSWPYPTGGDLVFPYRLTNETVDWNRSNIFQTTNWLDSSKELSSLVLPNVTGGAATDPGGAAISSRLHIFALTLVPVAQASKGPVLSVQYARPTQKWIEGSNKTQIYEVIINNAGSDFVLSRHDVSVSIESPGVETVEPGYIKRLGAGDQVRVKVGVRNKDGIATGSSGEATVVISGNEITAEKYGFEAVYGIRPYLPTYESIYTHDSPDWFDNGKYGIFIHWGPYWWNMNKGPNTSDRTYQYHEETYGPNVVYDDFIQNFTADAFDPKEWVDLFADAGANYFVQVSKHHDGYAIFDLPENVTKRTSVALFPHRDLLQELFDASAKYQPHLHRATYFSLPEWFHPDYKPYGFGSWPGGNATNPYTNETLAYNGYVPVQEFVADLIVPEMNALANIGVEIMWCDIGGPNKTTDFASAWFNKLADENKQALMNARCGLPGDFDTPEYARYGSVQPRKWETSQGMDPYSYGYNRATSEDAYMNASTIVQSLLDIVSKNGNFLLDIGPMANGSIVEVEKKNLREAGKWIKSHEEAIFNTTYWHVTPQEGEHIRFTASGEAFYISILARPNGTVVLESPIPWVDGDQVKIVGGELSGGVVPSAKNGTGVVLSVNEDVVSADKYAWVFKIDY